MWAKIKRVLTRNVGLKILAVILGILLWIVVVNVDNPNQTRTFSTVVQILNADALTMNGKYYTVADDSLTIRFRVTAKRSVMEKLNSTDFTATADMNYMDENGRIPIEINVAQRYASVVSISAKQQYVTVSVGERRSSQFVIEPEYLGTPAEGFAVDRADIVPNVISVVGPQEIVSTIDKVKAVCDVSGISSDVTMRVVPMLCDKDGNEIDTTKLELSVSTVEVFLSLASVKTVDIVVDAGGTLRDDLELEAITTDPAAVEIKGASEYVNQVTEITIPPSVIDLSRITESRTTTVDITSYLPEGVSLVDSSKAKITVSVKLAGRQTKSYKIKTSNIAVRNLQEGYRAAFEKDTIEVEITALKSQLEQLDSASITGYVDVSGLSPGTHLVPVSLNLSDGLSARDITVKVVIEQGR